MQITVNIPDGLAAQLQARGLGLESYVQGLVGSDETASRSRFIRLGPGPYSPAEAGRRIRELRRSNRLDGLKIKDLIEEGRRI
jgi:hypothetical protein